MTESNHIRRRLAVAIAAGCAGLALANAAGAVDLRDWGRKFAASERFVVLSQFGGKAVLDKETQLVWERAPDASPTTHWYYADFRCHHTAIGGRYGWRLPSYTEFMTLLDPATTTSPKLPAGHPFVGIQSSGYYWTGTLGPIEQATKSYAIVVGINSGLTSGGFFAHQESNIYAWCVRGAE